jgi:hypothetical protein
MTVCVAWAFALDISADPTSSAASVKNSARRVEAKELKRTLKKEKKERFFKRQKLPQTADRRPQTDYTIYY